MTVEALRKEYNTAVANGLIIRARRIDRWIKALERAEGSRDGQSLSALAAKAPQPEPDPIVADRAAAERV